MNVHNLVAGSAMRNDLSIILGTYFNIFSKLNKCGTLQLQMIVYEHLYLNV